MSTPKKKAKKPRKQHDLRAATLKRLGDYCTVESGLGMGGTPPLWKDLAQMFHTVAKHESKLR